MGSSDVQRASSSPPAPQALGPEALARVVLRCRELAVYLESVQDALPQRAETPFLYGQLDDVLRRLQAGLKPLGLDVPTKEESTGGFLRLLAGKKPRVLQTSSEARYDLQGNAWTIPVTELVAFLSHSTKSGLLWVTSAEETFVLEFSRGSLVHATSNAPPAAFRLGEILLREKMLEPGELAHLIQNAKAADDLLGSFLVRSGRIERQQLKRVLSIQVQELFHRLMDADNALYRFQEGSQLLRSQGLEVNITHLLLESARKKDEERQRTDTAAAHLAADSVQPSGESHDSSVATSAHEEPLGFLDEPAAIAPAEPQTAAAPAAPLATADSNAARETSAGSAPAGQ